ncbi:MAG: thioesterase family protein [Bacteroidia bacterium]
MIVDLFEVGNTKTFTKIVLNEDCASFESGNVHPVYATFALGRDAEWACRLFVLEMKEAHEEGIGTFLTINHKSPALVGSTVVITATVKSIQKNEIICMYKVQVGDRIIAEGEQGQKIIAKQKLDALFESLK